MLKTQRKLQKLHSGHRTEIILINFVPDSCSNAREALKSLDNDSSAIRMHKLITVSIQQKEFDLKNCRGQGCDGAAMMSGKYSGLQRKIHVWLNLLTTYIVL